MRFLLDQSSDARLVDYLRSQGHDAVRVGREYPGGLGDSQVLELAFREKRVLITDDRDFGDLVFRLNRPHAGVIYFRLGDYVPLATKIERLEHALTAHAAHLSEFIVVEPQRVRVRPTPS